MKIKLNVVILCMFFIANTVYGQVDQYQYRRAIEDVSQQWHSISLPQDILNRTNAQKADMRIIGYDDLGKEIKVPYLVRSLKDEELVESEYANIFNESTLDGVSVYVADKVALGKINRINLSIGNSNYDGRVKLEGKDGDNWFTILDDYRIFSFQNEIGNFRYTTLEIPESEYSSYRISLSNIKDPILNNISVARNETKVGKYYNTKASIRHIKDDEQRKTSKYLIELNVTSRISELTFDVQGDFDHYRRMELSVIIDSVKSKSGWQLLKKSFYTGAIISIEDDKVSFNEVLAKTIEMTVYNLDDQPLQINSVAARTPQIDLIARFVSGSGFQLLYGSSNAIMPRYDLANFKDSIPENLTPLKLGSPTKVESVGEINNFFIPTYALWAIMAVIIAVIGWFTIKMLSSETVGKE